MDAEPPRILFVDDEINLLNSLRRILRAQRVGWDMTFISDPEEAVDLAAGTHFDVIVSDLRMPGLSGIEMIASMRARAAENTEYILLTGDADLTSAIDAINKTGIFRFLTKPCAYEQLIDAVEVALASVAAQKRQSGGLATAALSALSPAVAVVDRSSRVAYLNESAEEVLASHTGIAVGAQGLNVETDKSARKEFREYIRHAAETPDAEPRFISIPDRDGAAPLTAVIMPLGEGQASVLFTVPGRFEPPSADALISLFGLTRVEAMLARTIAGGGTIEDAAGSSGVTVETARTYLKRIFQKVGVRRQVDLVQLILTTPASFIRSRSQA